MTSNTEPAPVPDQSDVARKTPTFEELKEMVGQELGASGWVVVDQQMIQQFADCTGDRQWIHVDPVRARRESPFRKTIAHGYLTLSLIGSLIQQIGAIPENTMAAFNYGLDRVRFPAPVIVGTRVRLRTTLLSIETKGPGQYLMKALNTIEIEGSETPAVVAETLAMLYERRARRPAV
jgi:acyl dehydratase